MGHANSKETNFRLKVKSKLFNSETSSDVSFVVGDQKIKYYAHRAILYMYSDVFGQMFYGGLKEKNYEIEVPDLDPIGFENMLKFMYGYDLVRGDGKGEMKPRDLLATYQAADKYLVEELKDELILGTMSKLNKFNVCLFYDQFTRMPFDDIGSFVSKEKEAILNEFKKFIQAHSKDAFESESFIEIREDTLVNLLELEFLNLPEFDVLKACLSWTNAEVERQGLAATAENKQKVFLPLKLFIRFIDLNYDQLNELDELKEVLSRDEFASLFLRLTGKCDKTAIDCKTERKKGGSVYEVYNDERFDQGYYSWHSCFTVNLKASQKVCITSIVTNLGNSVKNLELKVYKQEQGEFVPLPFLEFTQYLACGKWCLEPGKVLEIDSNVSYRLVFNFSKDRQRELPNGANFRKNYNGCLTLSDFGTGHCINGFKLCQVSNYETAKPT